jgi:Ca2+-binding EF-hand superfamily protein
VQISRSVTLPRRKTSKPLLDLIQTLEDKAILNTLYTVECMEDSLEVGKFKSVAAELVEMLPNIFGAKKEETRQFIRFFEQPLKRNKNEAENIWRLRCYLKNQQKFVSVRDVIAICQGLRITKEIWNQDELGEQTKANFNKIDNFFDANKDGIRKIWEEETPLSPDGKLSIMDFMSFLRDVFHLDDLKMFESKTDKEDFFTKINSYKRFLKLAEEYVHKYIKIDPGFFSFKDYLLEYDEVWSFVKWWLSKDIEMIVNYDRFEPVDMKLDMLKTLKHYEDKLKTVKTKMEATIIQKTIDVLRENLKQFDKGIEVEKNETTREETRRHETRATTERDHEIKEKALKEAFLFYCKQQVFIGKREKTFDRVGFENSHMNQGNFISFCSAFKIKNRDFGLPVSIFLNSNPQSTFKINRNCFGFSNLTPKTKSTWSMPSSEPVWSE